MLITVGSAEDVGDKGEVVVLTIAGVLCEEEDRVREAIGSVVEVTSWRGTVSSLLVTFSSVYATDMYIAMFPVIISSCNGMRYLVSLRYLVKYMVKEGMRGVDCFRSTKGNKKLRDSYHVTKQTVVILLPTLLQ